MTSKFSPRSASATAKSNTSFANQYAKAEELRLALLKDEMEFQKTIQVNRLEFEKQKYSEEKQREKEQNKSAVCLELIKAGLRGQDLLNELKIQFPEQEKH